MNKFFKILSIILCMAICCSLVLTDCKVFAAENKTLYDTESKWHYVLNEDGETVSLSHTWEPYIDLTIPSEIDGKKVTGALDNAFMYIGSDLKTVTIPSSIEYIGAYAFKRCSNIETVNIVDLEAWCKIEFVDEYSNPMYFSKGFTLNGEVITNLQIPENVTAIKNYAFNYCNQLNYVTIPEGVKSIGDNSFLCCRNLLSVDMPKGLESIGKRSFQGCSKLWSINLSDAVTIGDYAFCQCTDMSYVNFGDKLESIGEDAFGYCETLESVALPDSLKILEPFAFEKCYNLYLASINDTSKLERIGYGAFRECYALEEINIPQGVTSIEDTVFEQCTSLTEVTMPSSIKSIGAGSFYYCTELKSVSLNSGLTIIGKNAFLSCWALNDVYIPNTVESIELRAFSGCDSLESITIPGSVKTIGEEAFYWCRALETVVIKDGVLTIENEAFNYTPLMNLDMGNTVTSIGDRAFEYTNIIELNIPDSVTHLGVGAFSKCDNIKTIKFGSGLSYISDYCFEDATELYQSGSLNDNIPESDERLVIPSNIKSIGTNAFAGCTSVKNIVLSDGVETVSERAFLGLESLKEISIGKSVKELAPEFALWCMGPLTVNVDQENTSYSVENNVLFNKDKTTLVWFPDCIITEKTYSIPSGVKEIAPSAFRNCMLSEIKISNTVEKIGSKAFYGIYEIEKISIPNSVTFIGEDAFASCGNLEGISIGKGVTYLSDRIFYDGYSLKTVRLPDNITSIGTDVTLYSDSAVLYCNYGSQTAETLINNNLNYSFYGDINGDKVVNTGDMVNIRKSLLGTTVEGFDSISADTNCDESFDIIDLVRIKKVLAK